MENINSPRVLFNGYVSARTGFGTAARAYIHAFDSAALSLSVVDRALRQAPFGVTDPLIATLLDRPLEPDYLICHADPLTCGLVAAAYPGTIGITTWEGDLLPQEFTRSLEQLAEVWVPSRFNAEVFSRSLRVPVFILPHPIGPASAVRFAALSSLNDRCRLTAHHILFTTIATWQERKNIPGVVAAFCSAFANIPCAMLAIKTNFAFSSKIKALELITAIVAASHATDKSDLAARIQVFDGEWSDEEVRALLMRTDCYVSLHRSEGWCYPLFDAACNGTPVIATRYSGPLDYLSDQYHSLVACTLVSIQQQEQTVVFPFTSDMTWAQPDIGDTSALMSHVYWNLGTAKARARAGVPSLQRNFSLEAIGHLARERLHKDDAGAIGPL